MKKHLAALTAGLLVLAIFVSCASAPKKEEVRSADLPEWVINPPVSDDALYGVGYAKMARMDISRTTAASRARVDLARQLESQVQASLSDYFQEAGNVEDAQTVEFVESIAREVVNNKLRNTQTVEFDVDDKGGIWILVKYSFAKAAQAMEEAITDFQRNEAAAFAEFKATQALERLDYQLKNNPTKSEPVSN